MANNNADFFQKIKDENARKKDNTGISVVTEENNEAAETGLTEDFAKIAAGFGIPTDINFKNQSASATPAAVAHGLNTSKVLHKFIPPQQKKLSEMEIAVNAMARAIIIAMSEANISTIAPDIFGPIVALSGITPCGFKTCSSKYLDGHYFVLEHSNRIALVHKIIEEAYSASDSAAIALPLVQTAQLSITVLGNIKKAEVKYLLFSEEEIYQISLPYVKEVRVETDGNEKFFVIDVMR